MQGLITRSYRCLAQGVDDEGAQIGAGSRIWHFAHVCAGARIGQAVSLGQNVFVGNQVIIGDHCKIQNNVSVYDNVILEDGVFCGPAWCLPMCITHGHWPVCPPNRLAG